MRVRQFCRTTNLVTGKVYYFVECAAGTLIRSSRSRYEFLEMLAQRHDCFHSVNDGKMRREYKTGHFIG